MFKRMSLFAFIFTMVIVIPAAAQVPNYVPTDGLVGWWPFNGNANDESGNGNDGVVNGATLTEDRFGNMGKSYQFSGNGDYISVPDAANMNFNSNQQTISFWMKIDAYPYPNCCPDIQAVINKWTSLETGGFLVHFAGNGSLFYSIKNPNSMWGDCPISTDFYEVGQWNHFLFTNDGDTIRGYYNNQNLLNIAIPEGTSIGTNNESIYFGKENGVANFFNGSLDDIAIYNRALSEQEIQNLYTGQCPTVSSNCSSLPSNLQQGLVGYWPFCGNANDESGNGNDGVVNGATLTEDRFGNPNAAYGFDGVDDYIEVAYNSTLNLPLAITLSAWFQADTLASMRIIDKSTVGGADGFLLDIGGNNNNKYIRAILAGQSSNQPSSSEFISETNTWYNIIVTYDGIAVRFYVNNELDTTLDISGESLLNSLPLRFGANSLLIDNFFDGVIDDIGIWTRALTPEEVQELYTLDACTFTVYDTLTVYETVYDTVYTYETIYDTVTTYVTVTDTLLIDITFTGFEGQPSWLNTVTVFPNPASDHITIDYGNFALMSGYNTIITDAAGATVYEGAVNSQQTTIDINAWGATGVYYLMIYDSNGVMVAVRQIVLE